MSSLTTRNVLGAVVIAMAGSVFVMSLPLAAGLLTAMGILAAAAGVVLGTHSARLRDEDRLVYRPVYVRAARVHRPVRSIED